MQGSRGNSMHLGKVTRSDYAQKGPMQTYTESGPVINTMQDVATYFTSDWLDQRPVWQCQLCKKRFLFSDMQRHCCSKEARDVHDAYLANRSFLWRANSDRLDIILVCADPIPFDLLPEVKNTGYNF
jgi:hypothetical protein